MVRRTGATELSEYLGGCNRNNCDCWKCPVWCRAQARLQSRVNQAALLIGSGGGGWAAAPVRAAQAPDLPAAPRRPAASDPAPTISGESRGGRVDPVQTQSWVAPSACRAPLPRARLTPWIALDQ